MNFYSRYYKVKIKKLKDKKEYNLRLKNNSIFLTKKSIDIFIHIAEKFEKKSTAPALPITS